MLLIPITCQIVDLLRFIFKVVDKPVKHFFLEYKDREVFIICYAKSSTSSSSFPQSM
jgi:hypothetical protein